jgi:hypothetical protein
MGYSLLNHARNLPLHQNRQAGRLAPVLKSERFGFGELMFASTKEEQWHEYR